jgi:hypothetical protein
VLDGGEAFQVNFACDALTLSGHAGAHNLIFNSQDRPAGPPLVGEWRTIRPEADWSFGRDGVYRITRTVKILKGTRQDTDRGLFIAWADGTEWSVVQDGETLSITTNQVTERYTKRDPRDSIFSSKNEPEVKTAVR